MATLLVVALDDQLDRLAIQVSARRNELGLTRPEVRERGGPGEATLGRIENPTEQSAPPRVRTLTRLDLALEWEPGSAARILSGSAPTPKGQGQPAPSSTPMPSSTYSALSFERISVDVQLIGRLIAGARELEPDPESGDGAKIDASRTAAILDAVDELTSLYMTELLERTSAGARVPDALERIYTRHLAKPAGEGADRLRTEQLYRRWISGLAPELPPELVQQFQQRWRKKLSELGGAE